jgi:curved DNA-binding protein CbpA
MNKVVEYRKLLGADKSITLAELKSRYRNFMKEFHPDKFQDNDIFKKQAEEKSRQVIEAYHFLVSISSETTGTYKEQYALTISKAAISDINYKSKRLRIDFNDGSAYEYIGVPENVYSKLINADSPARFARRHIFNEFVYRNVSKVESGIA